MSLTVKNKKLAIVRGGGDLGTGVIYRLWRAHFKVLVLEIERPLVVRINVSAANAVFSTLADQKPIVSEFDRRPLLSPVILLPLILLTLAGAWRLERQARKNRGEKIKKS